MPRLSALRQLYFYHFYLWHCGIGRKCLVTKFAIFSARAKIGRAYLPDDIAAMFKVLRAKTAFAGVVRKTANFSDAV